MESSGKLVLHKRSLDSPGKIFSLFSWKNLKLGFPGNSVVKNLPTKVGVAGSIPGSGRSPGEANGNRSNILAWEIPWTEEPGGL